MNARRATSTLTRGDDAPISSISEKQLAAQFAWCQQVCQRSRSSFFASFRLLDAQRRQAMYALYAFARITDDLGDSTAIEGIHGHGIRLRLLEAWRDRVEGLAGDADGSRLQRNELNGPTELEAYESLWSPLAHTLRRYAIPNSLLLAIVEGVRRDLDPQPPEDWDALLDYCYHVASAVGLACVHVWRASEEVEIPTQAAIDCGIAFQLTNILRDVAEDSRQGRLYLPLAELQRHRVSPSAWMASTPDGAWQDLIKGVAERAEDYYQRGWKTIDALTPRSKRMFSLMWCSYRALLQRVVARRHRLWQSERIRLTPIQRTCLLASHMILPQRRSTSRHV